MSSISQSIGSFRTNDPVLQAKALFPCSLYLHNLIHFRLGSMGHIHTNVRARTHARSHALSYTKTGTMNMVLVEIYLLFVITICREQKLGFTELCRVPVVNSMLVTF